MGSYAPAIPFDDEEDERRRENQPYPPVGMSALDYEPSPYGSPSDSEPHLVRRSGEPVDMSAAPAISAAPVTPTGYPPIGSTEDLEQKASKLMPYHAVDPSPAEQRLTALTASGSPPVQPLHGFKKGLDILGQVVRPDIEQRLRYRPQDEYARNLQSAENDVAAEQKPAAEQAKTSELESRGEFERAHADAITHPKPGPNQWKAVAQISGPNGEPVEINEATGEYRYGNVKGTKPLKTPGETQEQNKLGFQGIVGKLDSAGLSTDPKMLDKSLDSALKNGTITPEEHAQAKSYQSANPNAATNLTVHVEGGQATQSAKDARTHVLADGPDGKPFLTTLDKANAQGLNSTPVKDPETVAQTGRMANTIQISMNRLADPELLKLFDNAGARAIIATATDDTAARQFGAVIPGIGGLMIPVPGGVSKFIDSVLQNSKLAGPEQAAVKKYLAGYWSAREAMMNLMRLQSGGKQGARGQFQAEAAIQQLPGGKTPDSNTAKLQMEYAQESLDQYRSGIPDELPGFRKEQSWKERTPAQPNKPEANAAAFKVPDGAPAAPKQDGHKLKLSGKVIAVSKGGQWAPPQ